MGTPTVRVEVNGSPATAGSLQHLALVNYGHFTAMQVRDSRVRGLSLHLARLDGATRELFGTGLDGGLVRSHIRHALASDRDASVRVIVFWPDSEATPAVMVTVRPPAEMPAGPQRLMSAPYQRPAPHIKHIGGFGQSYHNRLAANQGFDGALLVAPDGTIAEGAITNIAFFDGTTVTWPDAPCLAGITMQIGGAPAARPGPAQPARPGPPGRPAVLYRGVRHQLARHRAGGPDRRRGDSGLPGADEDGSWQLRIRALGSHLTAGDPARREAGSVASLTESAARRPELTTGAPISRTDSGQRFLIPAVGETAFVECRHLTVAAASVKLLGLSEMTAGIEAQHAQPVPAGRRFDRIHEQRAYPAAAGFGRHENAGDLADPNGQQPSAGAADDGPGLAGHEQQPARRAEVITRLCGHRLGDLISRGWPAVVAAHNVPEVGGEHGASLGRAGRDRGHRHFRRELGHAPIIGPARPAYRSARPG
jgi:Amino-transferase class IV